MKRNGELIPSEYNSMAMGGESHKVGTRRLRGDIEIKVIVADGIKVLYRQHLAH